MHARLSTKLDRTVAMEKLKKEGGAGQPEPRASIHTPVCIQQKFIKYLHHVSCINQHQSSFLKATLLILWAGALTGC